MINFKADFPLLNQLDIAYLDNAATAQRPAVVLDAVRKYYEFSNANPLRGLYELGMRATQCYEDARETVARFIHASRSEEIIFTRNTSESINLVMYSYALNTLKPGDEILVSITEHHSNLLPWQQAAAKTGATVRWLECEGDGSFAQETIIAAINEHTKIAAIGQISNALGTINPIESVIERVHAVGGIVLIDAAQSAPHMPIDVQKMDADFLVFSGHKMLAPMGIGVLYGKYDLLNEMPPFLTGGEMIESVWRDRVVYAPLPHKFEAGTVNGGGAVGLAAAIDYMQSIGWNTLQKQEDELTALCFEGMKNIPGVNIMGGMNANQHCGILSFTVDGVHPHDISSMLDMDGVCIRAGHHCAQPLLQHLGVRSSARASLAFYNTSDDVQRFLNSLKNVRGQMGYGA